MFDVMFGLILLIGSWHLWRRVRRLEMVHRMPDYVVVNHTVSYAVNVPALSLATTDGPRTFYFETLNDLDQALRLTVTSLEVAEEETADRGMRTLASDLSRGRLFPESRN